jgi:hypothetical protein
LLPVFAQTSSLGIANAPPECRHLYRIFSRHKAGPPLAVPVRVAAYGGN